MAQAVQGRFARVRRRQTALELAGEQPGKGYRQADHCDLPEHGRAVEIGQRLEQQVMGFLGAGHGRLGQGWLRECCRWRCQLAA